MEFNENLKTKKMHTDESEEYSDQRKELHSEIVNFFIDKIEPSKNKEVDAVLLGGGSNAGKSTLKNDLPDNMVIIDSDEIKEQIPEYEQYKKEHPLLAAQYVHDESSDIGNQLLQKTINEGFALIYDGTMKNADKYQKIIQDLKSKGYFVTLIIVDVPLEIARARNQVRYEKTKRMVPESILTETHQAIPSSYLALKDYADEYFLYDTREGHPILIAEKNQEDGEIIYKPELLEQFLNKIKISQNPPDVV